MGNSSSKSEKKPKKELTFPPAPSLEDFKPPLACRPPRPPTFATIPSPKRSLADMGPPVACAAVSRPHIGAPPKSRPSTPSIASTPTTIPPPAIDSSITPSPPDEECYAMTIPTPLLACAPPPPQFDRPLGPLFDSSIPTPAPPAEPPTDLIASTPLSSEPLIPDSSSPPAPTTISTKITPKPSPSPLDLLDDQRGWGSRLACKTVEPKWERELRELSLEEKPSLTIETVSTSKPSKPVKKSAPPRTRMACKTVNPRKKNDHIKIKTTDLVVVTPTKPASPPSYSFFVRDDSKINNELLIEDEPVSLDPCNFPNLSIDLFPVAKHLFRFLEAIDEVPRDPIKNLMAFALHRYNKWLDFINWCIETGQDDVDHRPPFDIEVVWVAHVIRTDEYKADCLRLFGREIPHVFDHKSGAHTSVSETTRKLWKERTGSDLVMNTEKFFNLASVFASNLASGSILDQNKTSITVCILIEDMKWFHDFRDYYPHSLLSLLPNSPPPVAASEEEEIQQNLKKEFGAKETPLDLEISESDKTFLQEAHRDYLRFLALQKKFNFTRGPGSEEGAGKICATYKIDLFWHSHMLNTREYRRDCESYLGDIVPHAPWPTEAVESLNNKFNFTADLWQREFGDEFQSTKP
eukprot:TRINITY_DN1127_c0_g1_i6.p1 TRINITY_DN1127_c0_g1~~TRINITY_DN1127_c0_g1_i6.p1  ORF type:complete len:635 (+),score=219.00 TRINITY_DN1127_c0_g1_i6:195-2099(+)